MIAHGENFLALGGVVINTETGARYENATIAECDGCPSDIDKVGYEYHAGTFVPCAPFGVGNNNGFFMEVCESCATPRSAGIPILGGLKRKNLDMNDFFPVLWENASPTSEFPPQTVTLKSNDWEFLLFDTSYGVVILGGDSRSMALPYPYTDYSIAFAQRDVTVAANKTKITFGNCFKLGITTSSAKSECENKALIPRAIYGVRI